MSQGLVTDVANGSTTIGVSDPISLLTVSVPVTISTAVAPYLPQPSSTMLFDSNTDWASFTTDSQLNAWFYDHSNLGNWGSGCILETNWDGAGGKAQRNDYYAYTKSINGVQYVVTLADRTTPAAITANASPQTIYINEPPNFYGTGYNFVMEPGTGNEEVIASTGFNSSTGAISGIFTKNHATNAVIGLNGDGTGHGASGFKAIPGDPSDVWVEMTVYAGKTATSGGFGSVGVFEYHNSLIDSSAGHKLVLFHTVGDTMRPYSVFQGPAPGHTHFGNDAAISLTPNGTDFVPDSHIASSYVVTHHLKTESGAGAGDGVVQVWYNGVKAYDYSNISLGTIPFHAIQSLSVFNSPKYDQSEFMTRLRAWIP